MCYKFGGLSDKLAVKWMFDPALYHNGDGFVAFITCYLAYSFFSTISQHDYFYVLALALGLFA